jgi:hypothetical protein
MSPLAKNQNKSVAHAGPSALVGRKKPSLCWLCSTGRGSQTEAEPVLALQLRASPDAGFAAEAEKTSLDRFCGPRARLSNRRANAGFAVEKPIVCWLCSTGRGSCRLCGIGRGSQTGEPMPALRHRASLSNWSTSAWNQFRCRLPEILSEEITFPELPTLTLPWYGFTDLAVIGVERRPLRCGMNASGEDGRLQPSIYADMANLRAQCVIYVQADCSKTWQLFAIFS